MNQFSKHAAARMARPRNTPEVAPISRAIRAALAVSATLFTLCNPLPSLATGVGSCGHEVAGKALVCDGAFGQTMADAVQVAPVDLTVVVDEQWPVSVHPLAGQYGIDAAWVGHVDLAHASDDGQSFDLDGMDAGGVQDVTVVNEAVPAAVQGNLAMTVSSGDASLQNAGTVQVDGYGMAVGIYAYADYSSTLDNSGAVGATAMAAGGDAVAYAAVNIANHLSYLTNEAAGSLSASAHSLDGTGLAVGAYAVGGDVTTLHNYGSISAAAISDHGDALAYAAVAEGFSGTGLIINDGSMSASATAGAGANAQAIGALAVASVASIFNDTDIAAVATAGDGGSASATGARALGANSAIYTYGDLSATATAAGGTASATGAYVYGQAGSATFYNAGTVEAAASAAGGAATVIGAGAVGIYNAYATNEGTITATGDAGQVNAVGLLSESYFTATTTNDGTVSVVANGSLAPYGQYEAVATGIYTFGTIYGATVDNNGTVSVQAATTADVDADAGWLVVKAIGVRASNPAGYGQALIDNTGAISASATTGHGYASAWGAVANSGSYGHGNAELDNDGTIAAYASATSGSSNAFGAYLSSGSVATLVNHGDISATARADRGVVNASIATAYATGAEVLAFAYGAGQSISNYGSIAADASLAGGITKATGLQAAGSNTTIYNGQGASIQATAGVDLFGDASATALAASAKYGVNVVNDGAITAYAHAHAYSSGAYGYYGAASATGLSAVANYRGSVAVVNHGDITAHAVATHGVTFFQAGAGATGVSVYAKYNAVVENAGHISAVADSELGIVGAYGVADRSKYYSHLVNDAGATIEASASVGSLASDQYGGRAVSFGVHMFGRGSSGVIENAGTILSYATATADGGANANRGMASAWGASIGAYSSMLSGNIVNAGDIEAASSADFGYAKTFGSYVRTQGDAGTSNTGSIHASAAAASGDAFAVGSYAFALHQQYIVPRDAYGNPDYSAAYFVADGGTAALDNAGEITAAATAHGGVGHAYGVSVLGGFVSGITNSGHISASVDADDARAVGALTNSGYGYASLQNSGSISAIATGTTASASGAFVAGAVGDAGNGYMAATVDNQGSILAKATATGDTATAFGIEATGWKAAGIRVDNSGVIAAAAYGSHATATAVSMLASGANVLSNSGTIGAYGDGARIAIASGADATATISNAGTINGSIVTGALDDSVDNAAGATWHAVGSSDFGDGDDHVTNRGTLLMDNAAIHLGGYVSGNTFDNFGTMVIAGAGNLIDMDNPFPVNNNGVISFLDGKPDDVLTIKGDLAGNGSIRVDVSGLHQTSDRLYVDGSVLATSKQAISVNLLDMPTAPSIAIPVVTASGSLAGEFSLGPVAYPQGFNTVNLGLKEVGNSMSLTMDVTGLNNAGLLASAMAPGVQSLASAQIGTWRQRVGANPEQGKVGLTPWVRTFSDSGDVSPARGGNFGLGGNDGFHQSNRGTEVGLDARMSDHVAVGILIGTSNSSQRLTSAMGSNRLDGQTVGLYATWYAQDRYYVDLSQRWTNVKASLTSGAANPDVNASASAFNAEVGIAAFTMGGVHVVPQAQYTHVTVGDFTQLHSMGSVFSNQGGSSSRGRVGVAFDQTFRGSHFSWTPYASVSAVREFAHGYRYAINEGLIGTTSLRGTSAMAEMGLGVRRGAFSITGGVNWTDGGSLQSVVGGQLVLRYNW